MGKVSKAAEARSRKMGPNQGRQEDANGIQKTAQELETFRGALSAVGFGRPGSDTKALKTFIAGIMVGVAAGHVNHQQANAISNAAGKILKTMEVEHKLGAKGISGLQPVSVT